jgi:hypothetical protein
MSHPAGALFFMIIVYDERGMDHSRDPTEQRQKNAQEKTRDPAGH